METMKATQAGHLPWPRRCRGRRRRRFTEVVAGEVESGGGDARSGRRCDAEVALGGGLRDEDTGGEQGESHDGDPKGGREGEQDAQMEQQMAPEIPARRPTLEMSKRRPGDHEANQVDKNR